VDPLAQTIDLLRPKALRWKQLEATGDWCLRFPATNGVAFCLVQAGHCELTLGAGPPVHLGEGDYVLLAAPPGWTLRHGEAVEPTDVQTHLQAGGSLTVIGGALGGPVTRVLGGHFSFDGVDSAMLATLLPRLVGVRSSEAPAQRLRTVVGLIGEELASQRPGRAAVSDRLLEVMLVEAIRHGGSDLGEVGPGLWAGLADPPLAAALQALHADVRKRWTVASLAAVAAMSRSVFAERFARTVGLPPMDYLLRWRMTRAKAALREPGVRLADVAEACGYRSLAAFSTAFRREVGSAPARYAAGKG
jgi:AraC-like DNA-binding protein